MKKIIYLMMLLAVATGCTEWLDAPRPTGETEAKDMFASEEGFRNVLVGVYINMAGSQLYGRNMSMYLPELMAGHWTVSGQSTEDYIRQFNFENSGFKSVNETTWKAYYSAIVNLNSLLAEIDARQQVFSAGMHDLIKGEALGLRAFLHFDVLRLWGPVPQDALLDPDNVQAIPYVTTVTKDVEALRAVSFKEVCERIQSDLDEAETLLANDPVTRYSRTILNNPNADREALVGDEFLFYRQNRFNLYAVKAAKARYWLWIGNRTQAARYANEVINATLANSAEKVFRLADDNDLALGDVLMKTEHIFAVQNYKLGAIVEPLFKAGGTLQQTRAQLAQLYENYDDDIRWKTNRYWEDVTYTGGTTFMFKKYLSSSYLAEQYVPVMRLSEMYFIAMECAADAAEASNIFTDYMVARNLNFAWQTSLTDMTAVTDRLRREYQKDFLGEGQMFFYLKRNRITSLTWPQNVAINPTNYVVPLPEKQSMFE